MLPLLLFWRDFPLFHYSILSGEKQAEHIIFYVSVYFRRTIGNAGGDRYSLFIICYSLFTEKITGMLSAGFSIGRKHAAEAAISGVNFANWGSSAHRLRRETAVGPADPEENGSGHCPPGFRIGGSKAKEAALAACITLPGGASLTVSEGNRRRGLRAAIRRGRTERGCGISSAMCISSRNTGFRRRIRDFVAKYGISSDYIAIPAILCYN